MGIDPSVGTVGDSYDNALAESIIGLFKAEVIQQQNSWKSRQAVEWETASWIQWFNEKRIMEPIGYISPKQAEENYYANLNNIDMVA